MSHRNTSISFLGLALSAFVVWGAGCSRDRETPTTDETVGDETGADDTRSRLVQRYNTELERVDRQIESLEARIDKLDDDGRARASEALAKLREERDDAREMLNRIENASADRLREIQRDSAVVMRDLESAYNRALEALKTN